MSEFVKNVVNLSIGAMKTAEQKSDEVLQQTGNTVKNMIKTGEETHSADTEKIRKIVNKAAQSLNELQEKAENFVSSIISDDNAPGQN